MRNIFTIGLLLTVCFHVPAQDKPAKKPFIPDTTVNGKMKLMNAPSIRRYMGDQSGKLIEDENASRIQFANSGANEYLIIYHLPGSNANTFNEFEIGVLAGKKQSFKVTTFAFFASESGIRPGIDTSQLIAVKGKGFTRVVSKGTVIFRYEATGAAGAVFLERYNMPAYKAAYYFRENKLIKFVFGFPDQ